MTIQGLNHENTSQGLFLFSCAQEDFQGKSSMIYLTEATAKKRTFVQFGTCNVSQKEREKVRGWAKLGEGIQPYKYFSVFQREGGRDEEREEVLEV